MPPPCATNRCTRQAASLDRRAGPGARDVVVRPADTSESIFGYNAGRVPAPSSRPPAPPYLRPLPPHFTCIYLPSCRSQMHLFFFFAAAALALATTTPSALAVGRNRDPPSIPP